MKSFKALAFALLGVAFATDSVAPETDIDSLPPAGRCIGDCYSHDPSVVQRDDGAYFKFSTNPGVRITKATDLNGPWSLVGQMIPGKSRLLADGFEQDENIWAPDCSKVGALYYCYYTISTFGSQKSAIGLAVSRTMENGTWVDLGATGVESKKGDPFNAIDPNLVKDGDQYYLSWGSFWTNIYQRPMQANPTRIASNAEYYHLQYNSTGEHMSEGPFIWPEGDYFYFFWSSGRCCKLDEMHYPTGEEYKIFVCRASTAAGPYYDKQDRPCEMDGGSILLASHGDMYAPGGQGVFRDSVRGPVLYYHYSSRQVGLSDAQTTFGWNMLGFQNGWPVVL
ncbi:hypothetical protein KEM56_002192 [Ascosphaera pollenicola]|nr:hypothetical protein KEM56_002192 [Ascosphaera pollenicola]